MRLTFHSAVAGLGSTLPAESVATTENVCEPFLALPVAGDEHGANGALSSEHLNVAGSLASNAIEYEADLLLVLTVAFGAEVLGVFPLVRVSRPVRGHHQDDHVGGELADRLE